jgi:HlyD family secretion protein
MRSVAVRFLLCFVAFCLIAPWSAARAEEKKKEAPAAKASATAKKADKEKAKDAKEKTEKKDNAAKADPKKDKDAKEDKNAKKESGDKKPAAAPPKTPAAPPLPIHEVTPGPFRVTVELKGVFEARRMAEVSIWPDQWGAYTVLKAAEHGKQVKQGELLIAFDPEKIDEAISDLRHQVKLSDIEMRRLQEQLDSIEKIEPMDVAAVDRRERTAEEDYKQFMKVDLPMSKKMAEFSLKSSEEQLAYAKEELNQLEKMYKADDVTEETEEIILRRARFEVAQAELFSKVYKQNYDEVMRLTIPRREESAKDDVERTRLSIKQSRVALPLALKKARLDMEKAKVERERLDKRLKELLADRQLMTVKSPADGILYYGECVEGRWGGMTMASQFSRGASVPTKKTLMTVVTTQPVLVHTTATEKDIRYLREGLKGRVTPAAYPDVRLDAVVSDVATVPDARTAFDTKLMVTDDDATHSLPGMNCSVKLVVYEKNKALTVPPTAVQTDAKDDVKYFVQVVGKDGKPVRRDVKVGERSPEAVEIVKGLAPGDKILKICPKDDGNPPKKDEPKKDESKKTDAAKKTNKPEKK